MAIQYWLRALRENPVKLKRLATSTDSNDIELFDRYVSASIKEANKRLGNLEKKGYTQYAYNLAVDDIANMGGNAKNPRYIFSPTDNRRENYEILMSIRTFLSKKTSTVTGQKDVERKRIAKFREMLKLETNPLKKGYIKNSKIVEFLQYIGKMPVRNTLDLQNHKISSEIVELLHGKFEQNSALMDEIEEIFSFYILNQDKPEILLENEKIHFDDLMKYLRTGTLPDRINIKELRSKYGLN